MTVLNALKLIHWEFVLGSLFGFCLCWLWTLRFIRRWKPRDPP
jgi:hypothetical protein